MRTTAAAPPVILSEAKDLHGLWGPQRATAAVTPVILSEAKDLHLKENKQAAKAKALSCHPERSEGSPGPMRLSPHLVCPPPRKQSLPTARAPPRATDGRDSSLGPGHSLAPAKTSRSPYSRRPRPPPRTAMDVPSLSPLAQWPRRPDPHLPPIRAQRPCQS